MSPRSHGRAVAASLAPAMGTMLRRLPPTIRPRCLVSVAACRLPTSPVSCNFFKSKHAGPTTCHTSKPKWRECSHSPPSWARSAPDPFSLLILEDSQPLKECKLMFQSSAAKVIPYASPRF